MNHQCQEGTDTWTHLSSTRGRSMCDGTWRSKPVFPPYQNPAEIIDQMQTTKQSVNKAVRGNQETSVIWDWVPDVQTGLCTWVQVAHERKRAYSKEKVVLQEAYNTQPYRITETALLHELTETRNCWEQLDVLWLICVLTWSKEVFPKLTLMKQFSHTRAPISTLFFIHTFT